MVVELFLRSRSRGVGKRQFIPIHCCLTSFHLQMDPVQIIPAKDEEDDDGRWISYEDDLDSDEEDPEGVKNSVCLCHV